MGKKSAVRVTPSTGNVFRDLGFSKEESEHLLVRADLLIQVQKVIMSKRLKQAEAAKRLRITQPRVSDLLRGRIDLFSTDALIDKIVYRLYGLTDEEIELIERHAEPRGNPHHQVPVAGEQNDVEDLQVGEPRVPQPLDVRLGDPSRIEGQQLGELEHRHVVRGQPGRPVVPPDPHHQVSVTVELCTEQLSVTDRSELTGHQGGGEHRDQLEPAVPQRPASDAPEEEVPRLEDLGVTDVGPEPTRGGGQLMRPKIVTGKRCVCGGGDPQAHRARGEIDPVGILGPAWVRLEPATSPQSGQISAVKVAQ